MIYFTDIGQLNEIFFDFYNCNWLSIVYATTDSNPCRTENGGCEMQCLYDPTTKVKSCACPSGMILEADGLHCMSKFTNECHV